MLCRRCSPAPAVPAAGRRGHGQGWGVAEPPLLTHTNSAPLPGMRLPSGNIPGYRYFKWGFFQFNSCRKSLGSVLWTSGAVPLPQDPSRKKLPWTTEGGLKTKWGTYLKFA